MIVRDQSIFFKDWLDFIHSWPCKVNTVYMEPALDEVKHEDAAEEHNLKIGFLGVLFVFTCCLDSAEK